MPRVWTRTTKQLAELGSLAVFLSEVSSMDGSFQEAVLYVGCFVFHDQPQKKHSHFLNI